MNNNNNNTPNLQNEIPIALSRWMEQVGVTTTTTWRWRRKGWLKTINICGRQYVTPAAMREFLERAERGDFAQVHKAPKRKATL
jgi:hypothetical protein